MPIGLIADRSFCNRDRLDFKAKIEYSMNGLAMILSILLLPCIFGYPCSESETEFAVSFDSVASLDDIIWTVKLDTLQEPQTDQLLNFSLFGEDGVLCVSCDTNYIFDIISINRTGLPDGSSYSLSKTGQEIYTGEPFTTSSPFFFNGCPITSPSQAPTTAPSPNPTTCQGARVYISISSDATEDHHWELKTTDNNVIASGSGSNSSTEVCVDCNEYLFFSMVDCGNNTDGIWTDDAFTITVNDGIAVYSADAINGHYVQYLAAACTAPSAAPSLSPSLSPTQRLVCEEGFAFVVDITADSNPEQVSWQLYNVDKGQIVLAQNNSEGIELCVESCGFHSFDIIDTGLDGITEGGSFETFVEGQLLVEGSDFGVYEGGTFEIECPAECDYGLEQLLDVNVTSNDGNFYWVLDQVSGSSGVVSSSGFERTSACLVCSQSYYFWINYLSPDQVSYSVSLNGTQVAQSNSPLDYGETFVIAVPECSNV